MEKFYSSKALLKMAGGGCIPHWIRYRPHSAACECGAEEQTANHIATGCPMYHLSSGTQGLLTVCES